MTESHTITCDKCGKEDLMVRAMSYLPPTGWEYLHGKDYCPTCYKKIKKVLQEFCNAN